MLSIAKLHSGSVDYLLNEVGSAEEYYLGSGEAPGVWLGGGSVDLGLKGMVEREALVAVLAGRCPESGKMLCASGARDKRVTGFDLTFSSPKSVSLAFGLGSDEISAAVTWAHDEAVSDAIRYLETRACFTRRGHGGATRIEASGLVVAAFRQRTSRNDDPQLHTHLVVANLAHGRDGRWSSLHAKVIYDHLTTAGYVYQCSLRARLVERLGVRFEPAVNGMADLAHMPAGLAEMFSKRRAEIEEQLARVGASSRKAAQVAALQTRSSKMGGEAQGLCELRQRWRAEAKAAGFDPGFVAELAGRRRRPDIWPEQLSEIADKALGPLGLTERSSTFTRREVVRRLAENLPDGARLELLEWGADAIAGDARVVPLGVEGRGAEEKLTTAELLGLERELVSLALGSVSIGVGIAGGAEIEGVLAARPTIATEQAAMVRHLASSGAGLDCVIGKAGAGKTYALEAARASWAASGFSVHGVALAARAARELADGAGISSTTLASFTMRLDNGEVVLGPKDIVVCDEAGMVGTRALHKLVVATSSAGAKLVCVGDPFQLPEIDTGGAFRHLSDRLGCVQLAENRRQDAEWERRALDEMRNGEVTRAVVSYAENGRTHELASAPGARLAMVHEWYKARETTADQSAGERCAMYALRRSDVEDLNGLARALLRSKGDIGGEDLVVAAGRGYAAGDEVMFCRNNKALAVVNGQRGVVGAGGGASLIVRSEGSERQVPAEYLDAGHLAHGYASTVHKAQGATVDRAFVLGNDALYREAAYVALSRARSGTEIFVVAVGDDEPSVAGIPIDVVQAFSKSSAKEMAVESLAQSGAGPEPAGVVGLSGSERTRDEAGRGIGR